MQPHHTGRFWPPLRLEATQLWPLLLPALALFWHLILDVEARDWLEPEDDHFALAFLAALFSGVLVGYGQIAVERWRGSAADLHLADGGWRAALTHKRLAAAAIGLPAVLAPFLLAYLWVRPALGPSELALWPRLLELSAVALWFLPAYSVAQWQALCEGGRPGEGGLRFSAAILMVGAPFACLAAIDKRWLAAGQGFYVSACAAAILALIGLKLADRAALFMGRQARLPTLGQALAGSLGLVGAGLLLLSTIERHVFVAPPYGFGAPEVLMNPLGDLAFYDPRGPQPGFFSSGGERLGDAPPERGWARLLPLSRILEPTFGLRRVPGTLRDWGLLAAASRQTLPGPAGTQLFVLEPSGALYLANGGPAASGPDSATGIRRVRDQTGAAAQVGARLAVFDRLPGSSAVDAADPTRELREALLCDLDSGIAWGLDEQLRLESLTIGPGDRIRNVRWERRARFDGSDQDSERVLCGEQGEYRLDWQSGDFVAYLDETPEPPAYQPLDIDGRRGAVGARAFDWPCGAEPIGLRTRAYQFAALSLRAPLETLVDGLRFDLFKTSPSPNLSVGSFFPFEGLGGLPLGLRGLHLFLAGLAAALTYRWSAQVPGRWAYVLLVASAGVLGLLAMLLHTRQLKVHAADGRWRLPGPSSVGRFKSSGATV